MSLFLDVEHLVKKDHPYRKILKMLDFDLLVKSLKDLEKGSGSVGRDGYGVLKGFKCILLQFLEDLSDRELARFLEENMAGKLFVGFKLKEKTPDFSYFSLVRKRIGTKRLGELFNQVREQMKEKGLIREVFTFVDASQLVSKFSTWDERDKAIKKGLKEFNNKTILKVANDSQARFGCHGKNKFWFGYKRNLSVDMQSGLINKVAITPANTTDAKGLEHVCPNGGAVFADKAYCSKKADQTMKKRGCHNNAILRNNMKKKSKDKDRWVSKMRSPYERVFKNQSKRSRYKGQTKMQFQGFMEALAFNLKRLIKLDLVPSFKLMIG